MPIRQGLAPAADVDGRAVRDARLAADIAAVASGDASAFRRLYRETVSRVYGLALRVVRTHEAAEEVAEDVYVQLWRTAGAYDRARGAPLAWILTITRSRALDYLRRDEPAFAHPEPECLAAPGEAEDPLDLLAACRSHAALSGALAGLAARDRQLLALAFFKGLSHQEIAVHAGLPLGTVKTHIRRALALLREALAPDSRRNDP